VNRAQRSPRKRTPSSSRGSPTEITALSAGTCTSPTRTRAFRHKVAVTAARTVPADWKLFAWRCSHGPTKTRPLAPSSITSSE
jgi:hypothetical protein